jgi:glycosyltransferase involved in cell wall biosynthesis
MLLFSVLMAHYNNAAFLGKAVESVLAQTYPHWQLIIVDDGSTDHFDEVIAAYVKHPKITVYKNLDNRGCGYTKRKCTEYAEGELMGFLDPDDVLAPTALAVMVKEHLRNPDCSLIYSSHFVCDHHLKVGRVSEYTRPLPPQTPYLLIGDGSIHHFVSFKKDAYKKTEGISPGNRKAVDQDLYYKLEEAGSVLFIDEPLYYYRIHNNGISNGGRQLEAIKNHYVIAEEACVRRIRHLKSCPSPDSKYWIKKYGERYLKIKIFHCFRNRSWVLFFKYLLIFPFAGGFDNTVRYIKKVPTGGLALFRKSFLHYNEIKP